MVPTLGFCGQGLDIVRNVVHTEQMETHTFTFGDRLRKARKESGIGSQDMADLLETSRTTISNYEAGRTEPPVTAVAKWAEITDVDLVWLIVGDVKSRCFRERPPNQLAFALGLAA